MINILDLGLLSEQVYESGGGAQRCGVAGSCTQWSRVGHRGNHGSGFYAALYENVNGDTVLSYRGTDDGTSDLYADTQLALGQVPHQFDQARKSLDYMSSTYMARQMPTYITGHSLGGGLAQMVGAEFDLPFVTFNAPGMLRSYGQLKGGTALSLLTSSVIGLGDMARRAVGSMSIQDKDSNWLNVRLNGDAVSVGTGSHIGPLVKIPGSFNSPRRLAFTAEQMVANELIRFGKRTLHMHKMASMRDALRQWPQARVSLC